MAPFAGYNDFSDCVNQNKDKDSPEAYCSAIHKKVTGKYPTENQEEMAGSRLIINLSDTEFEELVKDYQQVSPGFFPGGDPDISNDLVRVAKVTASALREVRTPRDLWNTLRAWHMGKTFLLKGGPSQLRIQLKDKPGVSVFELNGPADVDRMFRDLAARADVSVSEFKRSADNIIDVIEIRSVALERLRQTFQETRRLDSQVEPRRLTIDPRGIGSEEWNQVYFKLLVVQVDQGRIPVIFGLRELGRMVEATRDNKFRKEVEQQIAQWKSSFQDPDIDTVSTYFQDTPTRIIKGVEIFKAGKHRDSLGREREWTSDELGNIIKAFTSGRPSTVYVKLGHTSAEHNEKVAKELGIPSSILGGEGPGGHGSANLGHLLRVYRSNGTLIADLEVPEKVAALVESGLFASVSSEMHENYLEKGPAISGLALLGAERPALKDLKPLSDAQIMAEENLVYIFSMGDKLEFVDHKDKEKRKRKRRKAPGGYADLADKLHDFIGIPSKEEFLTSISGAGEAVVSFAKSHWKLLLATGVLLGPDPISMIQRLMGDSGALSKKARGFPKNRMLTGRTTIEAPYRIFSSYVEKLHHFIFGSGRVRPTPELIYQVPVTEETTGENGQTSRRVIVQHVRANTLSEARGVAFSALQSVLGNFGRVVGAGLGSIALILILERLGFREKVRFNYNVGNPTVVNNPNGTQRGEARNVQNVLLSKIVGGRGSVFQSYGAIADNLHSYNLATITAIFTRLPLMIIGAVTLKNVAFDVIARDQEAKQERPVRVWVAKIEEVEPEVKETLGPSWTVVGKAALAVAGKGISDKATLAGLGFNEVSDALYILSGFSGQSDQLHNFVSLKVTKTRTQSGPGNVLIDYALADAGTGESIGTSLVSYFPEAREIAIDWIQGNIGVDGVRQFMRQLREDFPDAIRVVGDRASGAKPGRILALPLGRFTDISDELHEFHTKNWITRKRVKPHSHRGQNVSSAVGTAKGALENKQVRSVVRRGARLAIKRRFEEVSDAIHG